MHHDAECRLTSLRLHGLFSQGRLEGLRLSHSRSFDFHLENHRLVTCRLIILGFVPVLLICSYGMAMTRYDANPMEGTGGNTAAVWRGPMEPAAIQSTLLLLRFVNAIRDTSMILPWCLHK